MPGVWFFKIFDRKRSNFTRFNFAYIGLICAAIFIVFGQAARAATNDAADKNEKSTSLKIGYTIPLDGKGLGIHKSHYLPHLEITSQTFVPLIKHRLNGKTLSGAAKRWQMENGNKRIRFFLRENLRWSDGTKVTGKNFVSGFKRYILSGNGNAAAFLGLIGLDDFLAKKTDEIKGLHSPVDEEVIFELSKPYDNDFRIFSSPFSVAISDPDYEEIGNGNWSDATKKLTYGAYSFKTILDDQIILHANPYYFDAKNVGFEKISYFGSSKQDVYELFTKGQVDILQGPNGKKIRHLIDEDFSKARLFPLPRLYVLLQNTNLRHHPKKLFQALTLATNRTELAGILHEKTSAPQHSAAPKGVGGYPGLSNLETQRSDFVSRLRLAKLTATEMGITDKTPYRVSIVVADAVPGYREIVENLKKQWAKINVNLEVNYTGEFVNAIKAFKEAPYDFFMLSYTADQTNINGYLYTYGHVLEALTLDPPQEYTRFFEDTQKATPYQNFNNFAVQIDRFIVENYYLIPLIRNNASLLIQPEILGEEQALQYVLPKILVEKLYRQN